jgi:hypothetical protein
VTPIWSCSTQTAVTDRATYLDPARPSDGVRHLLVGGTFVIRDGELQTDAFPGAPLRGRAGR